MTSLVDRINQLNISLRHQEDEYEYTSDFIEWFYENLCQNTPTDEQSVLYRVTQHPKFKEMREECMKLINVSYAKTQDETTLQNNHKLISHWLISVVDDIEKQNTE